MLQLVNWCKSCGQIEIRQKEKIKCSCGGKIQSRWAKIEKDGSYLFAEFDLKTNEMKYSKA